MAKYIVPAQLSRNEPANQAFARRCGIRPRGRSKAVRHFLRAEEGKGNEMAPSRGRMLYDYATTSRGTTENSN